VSAASWGHRAAPLLLLAALVAAWQAVVTLGDVPPFLLPSPAAIAGEFAEFLPTIASAALVTGTNALVGLVIGALVAIAASRRTRSGAVTAHSSARCPPIDAPTTSAQDPTPSASASRSSAATWSRTVSCGNRLPHGRPSGAVLAGPVLPWQPPSTFGATTNHRSVSIGAPGPTSVDHQPGVGWPGPASPVTCESPVSACSTSTAFEPSGAGVPQVS